MAPPSDISIALGQLATRVALDPEILRLIEKSFQSEEREQLITILYNLLPEKYHHVVKDLWPLFIEYCK